MADGVTIPSTSLSYKAEPELSEASHPLEAKNLGYVDGVAAVGDSGTASSAVAYTVPDLTPGIYEFRVFLQADVVDGQPLNCYFRVGAAATADADYLWPSFYPQYMVHTFRLREGQTILSWLSTGADLTIVWKKRL